MSGQKRIHEVSLILGSNIEAENNLQRAICELREDCEILHISPVYETKAEGSPGANFLNAAVILQTPKEQNDFKLTVLRTIEERLGRIRTSDKNAPRTIDLDILIFDNEIIDPNIWTRVYIAKPLSDIKPTLQLKELSRSISEIADDLVGKCYIKERPDVKLHISS